VLINTTLKLLKKHLRPTKEKIMSNVVKESVLKIDSRVIQVVLYQLKELKKIKILISGSKRV
jgi:hypothetical protein